uniref:Uncharacterized protein n=1 Tax=uncultured marine thaumarchaeote SAT1000_12_G12 TaxID=1456380 RepID=A0A075IAH0_9ARCH|nr:hypothetical protein [uncultured marine thaumarchaeote SAT1000_12_G12]
MQLYETADELKDLFKSILPKNSLLKTILKIDTYQDRNEVCDILLSYLGNNFFATLGKIRADEQIKDKWDELTLTERIEMLEEMPDMDSLDIDNVEDPDSLENLLNKSFSRLPKQVRESIEIWNTLIEKALEPKYIIREKLLQKICQYDVPDEPDKKKNCS